MDWADEETENITRSLCLDDPCVFVKGCTCRDVIRAALRKAKADGMREAANRLHELTGRADGARLWDLCVSLKDRANAIEKGTG